MRTLAIISLLLSMAALTWFYAGSFAVLMMAPPHPSLLLGYIGGKEEDITSKDHNFLPGETVEKQWVAVNNSGSTIGFSCSDRSRETWIHIGGYGGSLDPYCTKEGTFQIELPDYLKPGPVDIVGEFQLDHVTIIDTFTIHVMPRPEPIPAMNIVLFDPKGDTAKMLDNLGVKYRLLTEPQSLNCAESLRNLTITAPLIVGKNALDVTGEGIDFSDVPDGLRVIVFEQTATVLEKRLGFRTRQCGVREVFTRVADHPLLENIEDENLRDWRGGDVASVLIEKPADGDFLPILDGGTNLQYSPLLEYRHGKRMILFCQMDVTARNIAGTSVFDPAATHLVGNILRSINDVPATPSSALDDQLPTNNL